MDVTLLQAGDLVSCNWDDDGSFRIAKVLATEDEGIHIRVYAERFATRPRSRPERLTLGTIEDESFGVGHMALNWAELELWSAEPAGHEPVGTEELDGYEMWREAAADGEAEFFGPKRRRRLLGDLLRRRRS